MYHSSFWLGTFDRAAKSAAQALILMWAGTVPLDLLTIEPLGALGIAGGAALLSVLTSIASAPFGDTGSTSFLPGAS